MNLFPYDAFNGSLVEQDLIHVVGNEEPPCEAINQLAIGDIRPQEVHAIEVEAPHVTADLQPTAKVCVAVLLTQAAVPCRGVEPLHPRTQQQQRVVQFMDKTYSPSLSKMKMKRPPHPSQSKMGGKN
jgi:hypothetical protein